MKQDIMDWLSRVEQIDGVPPKEVLAFNVGIFESLKGYTLYLVGGFEYDEDDDDWACIEMPESEHRYLELPAEMSSELWESVLEKVAEVLTELELEGRLRNSLLKNAMAITTGFDDGELIKIR